MLEKQIKELERVLEYDNHPMRGFGICVAICTIKWPRNFDARLAFIRAARTWKHFSGNDSFPVPAPKILGIFRSPTPPSVMFSTTPNKWSGRYGRLRKSLLKHFIKYLKDNYEKK